MNVSTGGKSYRDVKEQANRISACNLTFIWDRDGKKAEFAKDTIVKGGIQLYDTAEDDQQLRLWVDTVRLSDSFFKALREHPVPERQFVLLRWRIARVRGANPAHRVLHGDRHTG